MQTNQREGRSRRNRDTASQMRQEAAVLQSEGRLAEADKRGAEAVRMAERLGDAREWASALLVLSAIRLDMGADTSARDFCLRAYSLLGEAAELGEDAEADRKRVSALCLAARGYLRGNRQAEARGLLERALTIAHYWLSPESEEKMRVWSLLGEVAAQAGYREEALEYYLKALHLAGRIHGADSGEAAHVCLRLGCLSEGWEDGAATLEPYALRAYDIRRGLFGSAHPLTAAARTGLGLAREAMGLECEAAEELLLALSTFDRHYAAAELYGGVSVETLRDYASCRRAAMRLLLADGRHAEAREYSERAQRLFTRVLGKRHPLVRAWQKEHDALPKTAGRATGYSAWDWWKGLSFGRNPTS